MRHFPFEELGRKDFMTGLILWLVLEVLTFIFLPILGIIPFSDRLKGLFLVSLPLGVGGAFLLGASSRFVAVTNERIASQSKILLSFLGQFGGGIGMAGVIFPLLIAAGEFFANVLTAQ
jgi:hypothetical protein